MRSSAVAGALTLATLIAGACGGHTPPPADVMPPVNGTMVTARTLRYIDVKPGSGRQTVVGKCVYAHYTGYLARDGGKIESSHDLNSDGSPGQPVGFLLGAKQVIAGWDLGFQEMNVGGQRRLYVPYKSAYGDAGRPPSIPGRADLVFDVEVLAVADSLPHAGRPTAARTVIPPSQTCPTWSAVGGKR